MVMRGYIWPMQPLMHSCLLEHWKTTHSGFKLRFNFFRELGITPGMGTTAVLPALVGPAEAAKLLFQVPRRDASAEDLHRLGETMPHRPPIIFPSSYFPLS